MKEINEVAEFAALRGRVIEHCPLGQVLGCAQHTYLQALPGRKVGA
jgi:hypothetical protein